MCAVTNMAVLWSSLTSCFPGMLLMYFLNDFEIVPVAPIIIGITFVFTYHMRCISIVRISYFRIFSASFLITFLSPEIATSINEHVTLLLLLLLLLLLKLQEMHLKSLITQVSVKRTFTVCRHAFHLILYGHEIEKPENCEILKKLETGAGVSPYAFSTGTSRTRMRRRNDNIEIVLSETSSTNFERDSKDLERIPVPAVYAQMYPFVFYKHKQFLHQPNEYEQLHEDQDNGVPYYYYYTLTTTIIITPCDVNKPQILFCM